MVQRLGFPDAVREARRELLVWHMDRLTGSKGAPEIAWWWSDVAAGHDVTLLEPGDKPTSEIGAVIGVDQLRHNHLQMLALAHSLGPMGRMVFSEIATFDSRRNNVDHLDVTASIWRAGLTVIDVDRVPVSTPSGTWKLVGGIARITP